MSLRPFIRFHLYLRALIDRWLFRLRGPERAPIVLGQRRIYVLPTSAGLGMAGALTVMLIASINYNLNLGYGVLFLLAGTALVSIFHAFRNLLHLSLSPGRVEPVHAGQDAQFQLLISNPRHDRRPGLQLKVPGASTTFELAADDTATITLAIPTTKRGWLPMGRVVLETLWPLGLIRAWSVLVPDTQCLVYPAPEAQPPPLPGDMSSGQGLQRSAVGDDDFAGLRAHQLADSPRHVAWKTVARGGPMLTKQFSGMDGGDLQLDWSALPPQLDTEARLARLSAWILAAEARGLRYALHLPNLTVPLGAGTAHAHACLKQLALF
jgi:uncharacterized protein (DUF58 family)